MSEALPDDLVDIDVGELVKRCAIDNNLFERTFFPKTFRQDSPPYAKEIDDALAGPHRLLNFLIFRGGFKTTKLRGFLAKRVGYGISRTILIIGKSEDSALRTSRWLRMQIERNRRFREVFGLSKGTKWQDHEFEIIHKMLDQSINVVAMGVTGSTRGINIDDYRPDLILLDDIISEENTGTLLQIQKINERVYGALIESLAPASEAPSAKVVSLTTPQHREDYAWQAYETKDPQWKTVRISCWTPETENAPLDERRSSWEIRWSSETLRQEKLAAMRRNKTSIFSREKEVKLVTPEKRKFREEWLKRWDAVDLDPHMVHYLIIDPVPPPSPAQIEKKLEGKDYEALAVVAKGKRGYFIRAVRVNRGHTPEWTTFTFFDLARKFKVRKVIVEQVAYQRTLAWLLRQAMQAARQWFFIDEVTDRRAKQSKIIDGLTGPAAEGMIFIPPDDHPEGINNSEGMQQFVSQFCDYDQVEHDDALEVAAIGVGVLNGVIPLNENEGIEDGVDDSDPDYAPHKRVLGVNLCP